MLIKTGIQKLDLLLKGGIKEKSSTLIFSTPGLKSLQFAQQITYNNLKNNSKIAFLINNKKPSILKNIFKEYDWNISKFEKSKKFTIINAYDKIIDKNGVEEIQTFIINSIKKLPPNTIIIIDSLSSFLDIYGTNKKTINLIKQIIETSKKLTLIALFTNWPYNKKVTSNIKSQFKCVIDLKAIEKNIILRNYFVVSKAKWVKNLKKQSILFDIIIPGGVREFIPKLLITGPFNAGKSTFTRAISTKSTSVDRLGTTIALDYGHINYKGYSADIFGTPGQARFDPLLKMLGRKALGIFLVLDPSKPETFPRAQEMVSTCRASLLPIIIVSNKRSGKKSLSISQIRRKLHTPKDIPIIQCDALKRTGVNKTLEALFKELGD